MCWGVLNVFKQAGWKKLEIFEAGEELTKLNDLYKDGAITKEEFSKDQAKREKC